MSVSRPGPSGGRGALSLGVILICLCGSCSKGTVPAQPVNRADLISLTERLALSADHGDAGNEGAFHRSVSVTRKGVGEIADVLVAPVSVEAPLEGFRGRVILELRAAPVFNVGDGVRMQILLVKDGIERELYSRVFDAARRGADREWAALSIPMDLGESGRSVLKIRASAGPHGDLVGDWLALVSPRLLAGGEQ